MFKRIIYKGLPVSVLLILSAAMQVYAVHAFAAEAARHAIVEQVR